MHLSVKEWGVSNTHETWSAEEVLYRTLNDITGPWNLTTALFLEKKNEVAFALFRVTQKRNIALSIEADEDEGVESCNNEAKQGTAKRWMST